MAAQTPVLIRLEKHLTAVIRPRSFRTSDESACLPFASQARALQGHLTVLFRPSSRRPNCRSSHRLSPLWPGFVANLTVEERAPLLRFHVPCTVAVLSLPLSTIPFSRPTGIETDASLRYTVHAYPAPRRQPPRRIFPFLDPSMLLRSGPHAPFIRRRSNDPAPRSRSQPGSVPTLLLCSCRFAGARGTAGHRSC